LAGTWGEGKARRVRKGNKGLSKPSE